MSLSHNISAYERHDQVCDLDREPLVESHLVPRRHESPERAPGVSKVVSTHNHLSLGDRPIMLDSSILDQHRPIMLALTLASHIVSDLECLKDL